MFHRLFDAFLSAPPPLSRRQRVGFALVFVVVAVSRVFAMSRTLWDWDEALFALALRDFNVPLHHPHPPGFPLFIAGAKLFRLAGFSEFHSLQAVALLGAIGVMPAMFLLARELRAPFMTALTSSVLLAFLPNVWFFGGTALSDVPSMTLGVLAAALLLRGGRDTRMFYLGAVTLGVAAGFRPQNLMMGFVPAVIAFVCQWRSSVARAVGAAALGGAIIAATYGSAAMLSGGWNVYREALQVHQKYITDVDSFRNPGRPSLGALFDDFFYRPFRFPRMNTALAVFVGLGLIGGIARCRRGVLLSLGIFLPFCLFAWLILDHFSVSRFSIAYMPLHAYLAAEGCRLIARTALAEALVGFGLSLAFLIVAYPGIAVVRSTSSPPAAAAEWIRRTLPREGTLLYIHGSMWPLSEALLPDYRVHFVEDYTVTKFGAEPNAYYLQEGIVTGADARLFARPRGVLSRMVRDRYFEATVLPVTGMVTFDQGWHAEESAGLVAWRWMESRSRIFLPPLDARRAQLTLRLYFPLDALPEPPTVEVHFNGAVIDRFRGVSPDMVRTYEVLPRAESPNELGLQTDRAVAPRPGDPRVLGLRLNGIEWRPAAPR